MGRAHSLSRSETNALLFFRNRLKIAFDHAAML
jgi:hypothetical protein